jgi:hypothetical protein
MLCWLFDGETKLKKFCLLADKKLFASPKNPFTSLFKLFAEMRLSPLSNLQKAACENVLTF